MNNNPLNLALRNLKVIITRPINQANELKQRIARVAGLPVLFPVIQIESSLLNSKEEIIEILKQNELAIFTSSNAITGMADYFSETSLTVAAIGPGTAKALSRLQVQVNVMPDKEFNSEGLLACDLLKTVKDKKIVIIAGQNGRKLLAEQLTERGAQVTELEVYCRKKPLVSQVLIDYLTTLTNAIVVITSCEGLQNLIEIMHSKPGWLYSMPLLVSSERVKEYAKTKGFKDNLLILAENATDSSILERLIKWYANQLESTN